MNSDTDADSLDDGIEDSNQDGHLDEGESDPRDPCDPILSQACQGVVLNIKMYLQGAFIECDSLGMMRDDLRKLGSLGEG